MSRAAPPDAHASDLLEARTVAADLLGSTKRRALIDAGTAPGGPASPALAEAARPDTVFGYFAPLARPAAHTAMLRFLGQAARDGAIVLTLSGAGARRGRDTPLARHLRCLERAGLAPDLAGYLRGDEGPGRHRPVLTIHDRRLSCVRSVRPPLAIIAAYNEADIIDETVEDFIGQGCDVTIIDNWSDDGTWQRSQALVAKFGGAVTAERFPAAGLHGKSEWRQLLARKAALAARHPGRWILHADADEHWRSPFAGSTVATTLGLAQAYGANRVRFNIINFRPTDDRGSGGAHGAALDHFGFGDHAMHFMLRRAWLQGAETVDLATTGGHSADFAGVVDFPYRLLIKHYPVRSQEQGARKIFHDRVARWSDHEREVLGWHSHYNAVAGARDLVWDKAGLHRFTGAFWAEHRMSVVSTLPYERFRAAAVGQA